MQKLKKFIFITLIYFIGMSAPLAKNLLMQCDYDANVISYDYYIKYRISYYDDETVQKEIALNGDEKLSIVNAKSYTNVSMFDKNGKYSSLLPMVGDNFTAKVMKSYYEKKTCPYLEFWFHDTNYYFNPTDSTATNDPTGLNIIVTKGKTTLKDSNGTEIEKPDPKITNSCAVHTTTDKTFKEVPGITIILTMYDNGKKYVKMYLTEKGDNYSQEMPYNGDALSARLTTNKGRLIIVTISAEQLNELFKQNFAQVNHNTFTCPSAIYIIEDSFSEGYYHLTTDKKEAEEYGSAGAVTEEGTGEAPDDKESPDMKGEIKDIEFCEEARVLKVFQIVGYVLLVIKILVPLLLIILGTVDFAKATISSDDKSNKDALNSLIRRIIIGVVIFIIPTILNYGLILVDKALDTASKFSECTSCLLDPTSCTKANDYMND